MRKKQTIYPEAFRREAVHLLESSGKSVSELSRELDIHEKSLYRWRAKYGSQSISHKTNKLAVDTDERDAELARLRRENDILRQERDILKKAISIVSRSQP